MHARKTVTVKCDFLLIVMGEEGKILPLPLYDL